MRTPSNLIPEIRSEADLDAAIEESASRPVILFKHSPSCPTSAMALREFLEFVLARRPDGNIAFRVIDVIGSRPVSQAAARRLAVRHESPQAFVLRDRAVVRHASHGDLVAEWFREGFEPDPADGAARS